MIRYVFALCLRLVLGVSVSSLTLAKDRQACIDATESRAAILAAHGDWKVLTKGQFHFLQGVFALNPQTPPGLPPGDGAVLATVKGDRGGLILFTSGAKICAPMPVPDEVIKLLSAVKTGKLDAAGEEI